MIFGGLGASTLVAHVWRFLSCGLIFGGSGASTLVAHEDDCCVPCKKLSDGVGSVLGVLIVASALHSLGLWRFRQRRVATDGLAEVLLSPSSPGQQTSPFARARRLSFWFLALLFPTVNALLYALIVEADLCSLLIKCSGLVVTLALCFVLLVLLGQSFSITQDFWIAGGIFGIFYVVTVMIGVLSSMSSVVLGLIHILITILMSILRYGCQEGFLKFEILPFLVAVLGVITACLPFFPCYNFSAYKIAGLIGGVFRFFDAIVIVTAPVDMINRLLARLHKFLDFCTLVVSCISEAGFPAL
ncbi:hypothetical protein ACP4OV_024722 [Aristida adscensionis]